MYIEDTLERAIGQWIDEEHNSRSEYLVDFMDNSGGVLEFDLRLDSVDLPTIKEIENRTQKLSVIMTAKLVDNKERKLAYLTENKALDEANEFAASIISQDAALTLVQLKSLKNSKELYNILEALLEELDSEGELEGNYLSYDDMISDALEVDLNVITKTGAYWTIEDLVDISG